MDNDRGSMKSYERITELNQLRKEIDAEIKIKIKIEDYTYIGKDGQHYQNTQELDAANKAYIEKMHMLIGRDGRRYSTTAELEMANKELLGREIDSSSYGDIESPRKTR